MHIIDDCNKYNLINFYFHGNSTMYWVRAPIIHDHTQANIDLITVDYKLLHHCLGHPSKDILRAAWRHIRDFPSVTILPVESDCPNYQLGKQPNHLFVMNDITQSNLLNLYTWIWSPLRLNYITDQGILLFSMITTHPKNGLNSSRLRTRHLVLLKSL